MTSSSGSLTFSFCSQHYDQIDQNAASYDKIGNMAMRNCIMIVCVVVLIRLVSSPFKGTIMNDSLFMHIFFCSEWIINTHKSTKV